MQVEFTMTRTEKERKMEKKKKKKKHCKTAHMILHTLYVFLCAKGLVYVVWSFKMMHTLHSAQCINLRTVYCTLILQFSVQCAVVHSNDNRSEY